jgi:hypothetical protein
VEESQGTVSSEYKELRVQGAQGGGRPGFRSPGYGEPRVQEAQGAESQRCRDPGRREPRVQEAQGAESPRYRDPVKGAQGTGSPVAGSLGLGKGFRKHGRQNLVVARTPT